MNVREMIEHLKTMDQDAVAGMVDDFGVVHEFTTYGISARGQDFVMYNEDKERVTSAVVFDCVNPHYDLD